MRHLSKVLRHAAVPLLLILLAAGAMGQQTYVTRFDLFTGYTYLNSPNVSLGEHGFHTQFGVRVVRWMSLGFDYAVAQGDLTLTPDLLVPATQQALSQQLQYLAANHIISPTYQLVVPASSTTQVFAGGPQFAYRHFEKVTFFIRPSCGIIHETATPHPTDQIATTVVHQLAPSGHKTDHVIFYGFGGGLDYNFSKHMAIRVQADLVRDHLFSDLLKDSRGTVRVSIGPCFNFGKNIAESR